MQGRLRSFARGGALVVGVIVAALILAAAVVRLPVIQHWAAAQVSARLPPGVTIGSISFGILPPALRLTNVSFVSGGPTFATVSCNLRVAPLLTGRAELATVVVDGAAIMIERDASGDVSLAGPLAALLGATGGATPQTMPAPAGTLSTLPAVAVRDGSVTFVDQMGHAGEHTLRLTAVNLTVSSPGSGAMPFTMSAKFAPVGQLTAHGSVRELAAAAGPGTDRVLELTATASGLDANAVLSYLAAIVPGGGAASAHGELDTTFTLSGSIGGGLTGDVRLTQSTGSMVWDDVTIDAPTDLTAHLAVSDNTLALSDGRLTIARLAAESITASALEAAFAYAEEALHVTSARATFYDGTWTQSGIITLADPPDFNFSVQANDVACDALLTALTGARPEYGCERLNASATVRGEWRGAHSVAQAEGTGRVELRGGTIPSSSILGAMWEAIVPLVGSGQGPRSIGAATRVAQLTESFALRGSRMHTRDLSLVTDDYTVAATGSVGLDGSLNLDANVSLTPAGVGKLLVMASLPIPDELPSLPAIPTRMTGTIGSPTILPEVQDIPGAALHGLFRGALGAGEAAQRGIRGVKEGLEKLFP